MRNKYKQLDNFSYIFVPFYSRSKTIPLKYGLIKSGYWSEQKDTYKYFLKYIVDKLSPDSESYCVQRFVMNKEKRDEMGIVNSEANCYLPAMKSNETRRPFIFSIDEICLFSFDTNVGILVFKIIHPAEDRFDRISTKCYHLKKVHTAKLDYSLLTKRGSTEIYNLSDLSEYILECSGIKERKLFFNYSDANEYRSNILTHYGLVLEDVMSKKDVIEINRILFYLRRNYYSQWTYDACSDGGTENFSPSPYIHWGITAEGTACVTVIDPEVSFVTNSFYKNLQTYYLMMYILCLHQKFALYNFLSMLSTDIYSEPETIKGYIKSLAEFRAKYFFGIISESETYQSVYERTRQAFGLDALFNDVEDQVRRISEIQVEVAEGKQRRLENRLNIIGVLLGFSCVFSVLVDVFSLLNKGNWITDKGEIIYSNVIACIIVLSAVIFLIFGFIGSFTNHRK